MTDHATEGLKPRVSQLLQQYERSDLINHPRLLQVMEQPDGQTHRFSGSIGNSINATNQASGITANETA